MRVKNPEKERLLILKEDLDLPADEQARFFYKLLPADIYYQTLDRLVEFRGNATAGAEDETRTIIMSGTQEKTVLLHGLKRTENILDEDGTEVHFPHDGPREAKLHFLSFLAPKQRREIAQAILAESDLKKDAEGNSGSRSGLLLPGPRTAGKSAEKTATA